MVLGSPIRRRIHVARSSNACIWMSRNSAAPVKTTRYGSSSRNVDDMLARRTIPATITAFSGRWCPNTAYEANWPVPHMMIPRTTTKWTSWLVNANCRHAMSRYAWIVP